MDEDITDKLPDVILPEQKIQPSRVTIDTYTAEGKRKYSLGVPLKDLVEGTDYIKQTLSYEDVMKQRPDPKYAYKQGRIIIVHGHKYRKQEAMRVK